LVLIFVVGKHRFDHEADVVPLKLFAVYRQALLTPTESDYFEPVDLGKFSHNLPKEFYSP